MSTATYEFVLSLTTTRQQGGELAVLKSIDWAQTAFDVLCIETDPPFRPPNYAQDVSDFMEEKGYINHSGQMGRNICKLCLVPLCGDKIKQQK